MRRRSEHSLRHRRNDMPDHQERRAVRRALPRAARHENKSAIEQTQEQGFPPVNSSIRSDDALRPMRRRAATVRPAPRRVANRSSSS
jgi:hypothetical protein